MRHLLTILAALLLAAPAQAQTLKSLMYNTTNGQVVYSGTNTLTFPSIVRFSDDVSGLVFEASFGSNSVRFDSSAIEFSGSSAATTRANLGLGATNQVQFGQVDAGTFFVDEGSISFSGNAAATTRTNLGATVIGNAVFTATNAVAARQALGLQSYTNTLTNSVNNVEIGSTVSNVTVGWTIAPTDATYAVRTLVGASQTHSITNNSSTLARTGLALTNNTTWTLTVGDGLGVTNTATTAVNFLNYMSWGRSANATLSNSNIQALHTNGGDRAFATSRSRSFTMDGGGQFIFIAYPSGFGSASFTVGGLPNTAFTLTTNSYTNASGYVTNYLIYRTDTIQNGTGINFIVQ